jgi:hypothetical protein
MTTTAPIAIFIDASHLRGIAHLKRRLRAMTRSQHKEKIENHKTTKKHHLLRTHLYRQYVLTISTLIIYLQIAGFVNS